MISTNDNSGPLSLQDDTAAGRRSVPKAPSAVPNVIGELQRVVNKLHFLRKTGNYFTEDEKRYIRNAGCDLQDLMFNLEGEE